MLAGAWGLTRLFAGPFILIGQPNATFSREWIQTECQLSHN